MPNGKPGDHPITDTLIHKSHPFPADIEAMLKKLNEVAPQTLACFELEPFDWAKRKNLGGACSKLHTLLSERGYDPAAITLRAKLLHSVYFLISILFFGLGSCIWFFLSNDLSPFEKAAPFLKCAIPLGPYIFAVIFFGKWYRNR